MLTVIVIATCVPLLAGVSYRAVRNRRPQLTSDVRGIALQTVIIIVVLLAIAGAVAGVLVTRGGQAVTELEGQDITRDYSQYTTENDCRAAGGTWGGTPAACTG